MSPANTSKVPPGTVLEEKFRISKEIGRGGMAAVYEAEHIEIGKRVAVKILAAELVNSKVVIGRFLREARATAAIRSPYICDVYDSGTHDGRPYLVMELLEGDSLYEYLSRERRIDPELTLRIANHAARGLAKAHEANIVHRDLKPENIFLTPNEDGEITAKILDFGLAKFYEPANEGGDQTRLTREGALFGTPAYMAPEQAKGQGEVDHRADLWALGCIVYECLTGRTVWNADQGVAMILAQIAGAPIPRPSRLRKDLPKTFDRWFLKALERDADKRFQTAGDFAEALSKALNPDAAALKTASLHSEEEGQLVDALVEGPPGSNPIRPIASELSSSDIISPSDPQNSAPVNPVPSHPLLASSPSNVMPPAIRMPPPKRRGLRAIAVLVFIAGLAVTGYAVWLYVLHPPGKVEANVPTEPTPAASETASAPAASESGPLEKAPYAELISKAQVALVGGKKDEAMQGFREAFNNGGMPVARSLLSQAGIALKATDGSCRARALGRPRPFDVVVPASRPSVARTRQGILVAWADNHSDSRRRRGFATLLDDALRRVSPARSLTPEATQVRHTQLVPVGKKLGLIYWDNSGKQPGVYARLLETDGRIAGAARQISKGKPQAYYPTLVQTPEGLYYAIWQELREEGGIDLVARRLDASLKPRADAVRLTKYPAPTGMKVSATRPDAVFAHGHLWIVYGLERGHERFVMLLRLPEKGDGLVRGLRDEDEDDKKYKPNIKSNKKGLRPTAPSDRNVGMLSLVSAEHGKNTQPRIACPAGGCFIVWDDEAGGAHAAYAKSDGKEVIWRREIASRGSRPAIATAPTGEAAVTWFETGRLKFARITQDGVAEKSTIGRVSGFQPYPAIVPDKDKGGWIVVWRDFESGHHEVFATRVLCE